MKIAPALACAALLAGAAASASESATREPLALPADSPLDLGEGSVRILADGARTGGGWSTLERTEPPGTRNAPHRHNRMDEAFSIVPRSFTVFVGGKLHRLGPRAFVHIPRG